MNDRTRIRVGRSMAAVGVLAALVGWVWLFAIGQADRLLPEWILFNGTIAIGSGLIAWIVLPHQPRNGAIWPFAIVALTAGTFSVMMAWIIDLSLDIGLDLAGVMELTPADLETGPALVAMMLSWLFIPFTLLLTVALVLFPDGQPPSPRWRWTVWASYGAVAVESAALVWLFRPSSTLQYTVAESSADFVTNLGPIVAVADIASQVLIPVCLVGMIVRFRRSTGGERQQFRWVVWGAGVSGSIAILSLIGDLAGVINSQLLAMLIIPIFVGSYGVAIAKYRLYDIDVVISRTVVLGVLAGFITLTYSLVVVGLGQLVGEDSDGLLLQIAATAVIAVAFEPVRNIAQAWANRLVYGKRATPYEVLSDLTQRLGRAEEGEGILIRLAVLLRDGTGAERATVWLGVPGAMDPASTSPPDANVSVAPDLDDPSTFTVFHDGEVIGALEVVKPRGTVLSTAEKSLVTDLAGSAGAVLGYQRLNDSLAERARELEESRARLMGVQDQERRRLERDLHEGAEQFIVALKVKIGVASQLAGKHDAPDLEELLYGLTEEAQAALDDVQSLAKGIYPPILESDGLGAAISALASSSPVEVRFERDGLARYPMEIEAAVYFDVSEAVTNAVKHAEPPIRIVLSHHDGMLTFSVVDAGPGFEIDKSELGSGLENMADRLDAIGGALTVKSARGESTEVSGTIPVESLALI